MSVTLDPTRREPTSTSWPSALAAPSPAPTATPDEASTAAARVAELGRVGARDTVTRSTGLSGGSVARYASALVGSAPAAPAKAKPGGTGAIGAAKPAPAYPAFAKLPEPTQKVLEARMTTHAKDPAARASYVRLATDPSFAKLSPDHQRQMIEALDASPKDPKLVDDLLTLAKSDDFRALDSNTATDVLKRMGRTSAAERAGYLKLATSDGFKRLARKHQSEVLGALDRKPADAALAADLTEAANSDDFRLCSDEAKSEVIAGLGRLKDDPAARRTLLDVAKTPGLRGMRTEDSMAILRVAGGTSGAYSGPARAELRSLVADHTFQKASAADQTARLAKLVADQSFLPGATTAPSGTMAPKSKPKIIGPITLPGSSDQVYGVDVDGRTIPVKVKTPPPGTKHHTIQEIADGLAATPKETRDEITEVVLVDHERPNAYAASSSTGVVEFYPSATRSEDTNFMASALIHEMGHTISGRAWGDDTSDRRWNAWKAAMAKDALSPSRYGHTTPGAAKTAGGGSPYADDFAESWLLYQRVKGTPEEAEMRRLFPERFKIMDTM